MRYAQGSGLSGPGVLRFEGGFAAVAVWFPVVSGCFPGGSGCCEAAAVLFVEYDRLVAEKSTLLPELYDFISLQYKKEYADKIHAKSVQKADRLSRRERDIIKQLCEPIYNDALSRLLTG